MVNHAAVTGLRRTGDQVTGAVVDTGHGEIDVSARAVINATGVWADELRALDEGVHPHAIHPAKGIHITVPWHKVRNEIAAVVPVPKDRRSVFVVPWPGEDGTVGGPGSVTYIGTTDTDYSGDVDDPQCTAEDIAYLLDAVNNSLTEPLDEHDVIGTWAGLRPLVRDASSARTADMSRRHRITTSASGLVTVVGGKLTTYREMAEDTVEAALGGIGSDLPWRAGRSRTRNLRLRGAEEWEDAAEADLHLAERYGGETGVLQAMIATDPSLGEPLVPGLPYRRAEAVYAVRYEMATTLDVLPTLAKLAGAAEAQLSAASSGPGSESRTARSTKSPVTPRPEASTQPRPLASTKLRSGVMPSASLATEGRPEWVNSRPTRKGPFTLIPAPRRSTDCRKSLVPVSESVERIYKNREEHDPSDLAAARRLAAPGPRIPIGLFYRNPDAPRYEQFTTQGLEMGTEAKLTALEAELDRFAI